MIDYKTIISTTDSKVTLMQWLQALTEEFGDAKIKSVTFDVSTTRLSLTIQKEDGTAFTTTQVLYSLTADEQSLINNLIKSVTASSDGVTFSKAVSFQGNESHNGSEIHNGYASFLGDENHAGSEMHKGTATFTDLRSDDLTATDGQELMSWDGTTTALKGKADRPTYNGGDLALKSDVTDIQQAQWKEYYAQCNVRKYEDKSITGYTNSSITLTFDNVENKGTSYFLMYAETKVINANGGNQIHIPVKFSSSNVYNEFPKIKGNINFEYLFFHSFINSTLTMPAITDKAVMLTRAFAYSQFTKILIDGDGEINVGVADGAFSGNTNLTEIGNFNLSNASGTTWMFEGTSNLTAVHCTHFKSSFNMKWATKLTESAVQEIFGNLDVVSSTQTVTLPAVVYDILTTADIAIATGKGWAVARAS